MMLIVICHTELKEESCSMHCCVTGGVPRSQQLLPGSYCGPLGAPDLTVLRWVITGAAAGRLPGQPGAVV